MKKYIKPSIEVVQFKNNCPICAGSSITNDFTADTTGEINVGDASDANARPTFGIWDDED